MGWCFRGLLVLTLALAGCVPGGGGSGGGGSGGGEGGAGGGGDMDGGVSGARAPARLSDSPADTLAHGAAIGALDRLAGDPGFDVARMGDPGTYLSEEADTPSAPSIFASVYYQTTDLAESVEGARDRRPGVEGGDEAGARIASSIATAIQLGAVAEGNPDGRGGARWHALQSARRLDAYSLYAGWRALDERSAAGFDRFLGLLWSAGGAPHGTGARLAATDALCGTDYLATIADALGGARGPFESALSELGQLDPLDRLVIGPGDSPEYDAAIGVAIEALADGLAVSLLATMADGIEFATQAELLGALAVIATDLRIADAAALDSLGVALDAANPNDIDPAMVRDTVSQALGVDPCAL